MAYTGYGLMRGLSPRSKSFRNYHASHPIQTRKGRPSAAALTRTVFDNAHRLTDFGTSALGLYGGGFGMTNFINSISSDPSKSFFDPST